MTASQIRAKARENLSGKWGKSALLLFIITIMLSLIVMVVSLFSIIPVIGFFISIGYFIISVPLSYGILISFLKLKREEEVGYMDFFSIGFSSFGKIWAVVGNIFLKYLPYIICIIVAIILMTISTTFSMTTYLFSKNPSIYSSIGFIILTILSTILLIGSYIALIPKTFSLALVFPLLYDNPNRTGKEIVEESIRLMQGNRSKLFWLYLTFIGWAILSIFTFYIGYLFLIPYMIISFICFYEILIGKEEISVDSNNEIVKTIEIAKEEDVIVEDKSDEKPTVEENNNPIQSDEENKKEE